MPMPFDFLECCKMLEEWNIKLYGVIIVHHWWPWILYHTPFVKINFESLFMILHFWNVSSDVCVVWYNYFLLSPPEAEPGIEQVCFAHWFQVHLLTKYKSLSLFPSDLSVRIWHWPIVTRFRECFQFAGLLYPEAKWAQSNHLLLFLQAVTNIVQI